MQLAISHNNMDFDSLAAQFAVTKIYPSARMALGYPIVGNIRAFLSLYRSNLPIVQLKYLDAESVSQLYLVDCQQIDRLDPITQKMVQRGVPCTVFDHHEFDPEGLGPKAESDSIIEPVGAATTLLVEQLIQRKIRLTTFEATLLAIGIYEDTGCLSYKGTTSRDADCAAHLLKAGADLNVVNEYIRPKLNEAQLALFQLMIQSSDVIQVEGKRIAVASAAISDYMDGLATLTRKLMEVDATDAAFSVVHMRDRVHIVGRSDTPSLDVKRIVREFSGDGHPGAGSAVVKDTNYKKIAAKLKDLVRAAVTREITAAEIMVSPVRTIRPDVTMEEAGKMMIRYGIDGVLIADNEDIIGVVSRRDIDQATHHKLAHAPVSGFMSRPVISIKPDTPLSEIQEIIVRKDIGRLPVLDEHGHLLGLVSRHDVLRHSFTGREPDDFVLGPFGSKMTPINGSPRLAHEANHLDLSPKLERMNPATYKLFQKIGKIAHTNNMVAYAVGGLVRDLILGIEHFDLDFVIEGSAIELAHHLAAADPKLFEVIATHDRFQTATIHCHGKEERLIDLSTARTEFYEFPAALPTVEPSVLEQDLFRRDFTINALAVSVNPESFGILVDHFDGLKDLKDGLIRILHQFSFIEDPTRLLRAARFAGKLGLHLEKYTSEQARRAISIGIFDNLGGARMKAELKLILESPFRLKALDVLSKLGGKLRYLDEQLEYGPQERKVIRRAEQLLSRYSLSNIWVVYLALLLARLSKTRLPEALARLHLTNEERDIILNGYRLYPVLAEKSKDTTHSEIYELMHGSPDEALAIAACLASPGSFVRRMSKIYFDDLKEITTNISGKDLKQLGLTEGPQIGQALRALLEAKLNGLVSTEKEEMDFVKKYVASAQALAPPSVPQ